LKSVRLWTRIARTAQRAVATKRQRLSCRWSEGAAVWGGAPTSEDRPAGGRDEAAAAVLPLERRSRGC
jgi:hypothetical protein